MFRTPSLGGRGPRGTSLARRRMERLDRLMGTELGASRENVARVWASVLDGSLSREKAHSWAARWVEGGEPDPDILVNTGLQYIHGYSLRSQSGAYLKGTVEIEADLRRWTDDRESYDRAPEEWIAARMEMARRFVAEEAMRKAAPRP